MSIYLSVFDCVWERAQILASQILPSVDKLQHTMIHESKGKLYPQNHQASLYSNKCCRASVLFLYQTTIYLTFQKVLHQNLQEFHIKISIEVFQSQRRKVPESFGGDSKEIASSSFASSSRSEARVMRASTSSCSVSRAETKSCLAMKEYEY